MRVTIEEVLKSSDTPTVTGQYGPYLIYSEILEGARRPLAFIQVAEENFELIGKLGRTIQYIGATQLSATESTETYITGTGMSASDKTLSSVDVEVDKAIWSAVSLSDFLKEDFPNINWVRLHLRNMASAVMEKLDELVYDTISGAPTGARGNSMLTHTATASDDDCSFMDYADVLDALAKMANVNWDSDRATPFLIVGPEVKYDLMKSDKFVTTERYTTANIAKMVGGEVGLYGGCKVLQTSHLDDVKEAYIVFPPNSGYGPVVIIAWKRRLTVKNEYEATKGYTYFNTSIRAEPLVVQSRGICKITLADTP